MTDLVLPKPGTRKVTVGAVAGAAATIISYILAENGVNLTKEAFGAISTVITAIFVYATNETFT